MKTAEECKKELLSIIENKYRKEFNNIDEDLNHAIYVNEERFASFEVDLETKDIQLFKEIIKNYGYLVSQEIESANDNFSKVSYKIYF